MDGIHTGRIHPCARRTPAVRPIITADKRILLTGKTTAGFRGAANQHAQTERDDEQYMAQEVRVCLQF